jgi:mannose-6-phosphate isomerase-like protein (cupin superfamily)
MARADRELFDRQGYVVLPGLFSTSECAAILRALGRDRYRSPATWHKGAAVSIESWSSVARSDRILDEVEAVIGPDIVLWGASLVRRSPKQVHRWHRDLEAADREGFASVWIGLRGTTPRSALSVLPGSHRLAGGPTEAARRHGSAVSEVSDPTLAELAAAAGREHGGPSSVRLQLTDGDAVVFDGRLWHASRHDGILAARSAILLQFARADLSVRIPKFLHHREPTEYFTNPAPPCLVVRGRSDRRTNRIMPAPSASPLASQDAISTLVESLAVKPGEPEDGRWKSFPLLNGPSTDLRSMESHFTVLNPGESPHAPHRHDDEELLVVVDGEATLLRERERGSDRIERIPVARGDFVHYPRGWSHTIENTSAAPVVYLMFRWQSDDAHETGILDSQVVRSSAVFRADPPSASGGAQIPAIAQPLLLEGKTRYLRKLHAHATTAQPGAGYDAHADAYDVGLVLLEGRVETLGETVAAPAVVYYAAGEAHGLRSVGETPAHYLAFEFHGRHCALYEHPHERRRRRILQAIRDPRLILGHLKWLLAQRRGNS